MSGEILTATVPGRSEFPDASLPAPLTGFVGRDEELAAVRALLAKARLVTLTGAGGSGKTRLALAVAEVIAASDAGAAVAWVELAALADADALLPHVGLMLGARADVGTSPMHALVAQLQDRDVVLVLDNCEHLVDASAQLVDRLLRGCPRLRIIATSREALGVTGERSWLVPTLSLPAVTEGVTVEQALATGAVRLFVERARDVLPGFSLTPANVEQVTQVCRRLDGLPLAIELAAARSSVLTPAQLAARLDDRFALLTSGSRSAAPRQRTLRGAVDWSYELLADDERLLLARLSIFAGGFTLDAAEAVCADDLLPTARVLEVLAALVAKSLVSMQEDAGTARYQLLETIREYASDRLAERPEAEAIAAHHAAHYRDIVHAMREEVILGRAWRLHEIDVEHSNLMSALSWSAAQGRGSEIGLPICYDLLWYWYHRQLWREGFVQVRLALGSAVTPSAELRAAAAHGLGVFGLHVRDPGVGEHLAEARRLWPAVGNERWLAFTLLVATVHESLRGDVPAARACAEQMIALAARQPDPWDLALARAHAMVPVLNWQGEWGESGRLLEDALQVFREREYPQGVAYALDAQAFVALQLGDHARAAALAVASIRHEPTHENRWLAGRSLRILAAVAVEDGAMDRAVTLLSAAEAMYEAIGAASLTGERRAVNELPARLRSEMEPSAFQAAWDAGRRLSFRDALALALEGAAAPPLEGPSMRVAFLEPTTTDTVPLEVRSLGSLAILRDGRVLGDEEWPYAKPRELLLYLLVHPDGRTREQIGLDFWPEGSPAQVKNNFHVTLHHLRKALGGSEWIRFERGRYRVARELGVRFDAERFERDVTAGLRALKTHPDDPRGAERLASAVDSYTGPFLDDVEMGDWHVALRDRLARLHAEALLALGEVLGVEGQYPAAALRLQQLLEIDPVDETAARLLMLTLARDDRRSEALRVYDRLCDALRRELEAEPSSEVTRAADAIRRGVPV